MNPIFRIMADWPSDILTGKRILQSENKMLIPKGKYERLYSPADFTLRTRTAR